MQKNLLYVTVIFNFAVNGLGAKKSPRFDRVLVTSGIQCTGMILLCALGPT